MISKDTARPTLIRHGWIKVLAAALLFAACDSPYIVKESCSAFEPPCGQRHYALILMDGQNWPEDETNRVDSLVFSVNLTASQPAATSLTKVAKTSLSCAGCEDYFEPDSVYFTTAFVTQAGDTLPARHNFVTGSKPVGIKFFNSYWIGVDSVRGFRDSVFNVRFVGKVEGIAKSASITLHIANPALLYP